MPKTAYITALHIIDRHDGTTRCMDYLLELARKHGGNRAAMAKEAGVCDVTIWRYIRHYREAHGEVAMQQLFAPKETA